MLAFVAYDFIVEGSYLISGVWGISYAPLIMSLREGAVSALAAVVAGVAFLVRPRLNPDAMRHHPLAVAVAVAMGLGWFGYTQLLYGLADLPLPIAIALSLGAGLIAFVLMESVPPGADRMLSPGTATLRAVGFSAASLAVAFVLPWVLANVLVI